MELWLKRIASSNLATFGVLGVGDMPEMLTLELPWLDNEKGKSCIRPGIYDMRRKWSANFNYQIWELLDVAGRVGIYIHKGNTSADSSGCILVGRRFGRLGDEPAVLESKAAYERLEELLRGQDKAVLCISEHFKSRFGNNITEAGEVSNG